MSASPEGTAAPLPAALRELLHRIHREVLPLGVREHLLVATLWQLHQPSELRAGIASVLATEPRQWDEIARRFDLCIPKELLRARQRELAHAGLSVRDAPEPTLVSILPSAAPLREEPTQRMALRAGPLPGSATRRFSWASHLRHWLRSQSSQLVRQAIAQLNHARAYAWVALLCGGAVLLTSAVAILFFFLSPRPLHSGDRPEPAMSASREASKRSVDSTATGGAGQGGHFAPGAVAPGPRTEPLSKKVGEFVQAEPALAQNLKLRRRPRAVSAGGWLALSLLTALLSLMGIRWFLLPTYIRRVQATLIRRQEEQGHHKLVLLAEAELRDPGPPRRLYHFEPSLPFDPTVLEDSAGLLGRTYRQSRGLDLDIEASLRATMEAGGRALPVYVPYRSTRELLILLDFERGGNPWLASFLRVIELWQRQGIPITAFRFSRRPERLQSLDNRQNTTLHALARTHDSAALLVFSRNLSIGISNEGARWLEDLEPWPMRVWIDPDPRPLDERHHEQRQSIHRIEQHGLVRFPYTPEGVLTLARYLAAEGIGVAPPEWPSLPSAASSRLRVALKQWAAVAALVPEASWEQLEVFRCELPALQGVLNDPRYVQRLIEFVSERIDEPADLGDALLIPPDEEDRLIRSLRAGTGAVGSLEAQARQVLLTQLGRIAPGGDRAAGSLDYWRWLLKVNGHLAVLEPERAMDLYVPLLGSPVDAQARSQLRQELVRQPVQHLRLRRLLGLSSDLMLRELVRGQPALWRRAALLAAPLWALAMALTWTVPWLLWRLGWLTHETLITFPATLLIGGAR